MKEALRYIRRTSEFTDRYFSTRDNRQEYMMIMLSNKHRAVILSLLYIVSLILFVSSCVITLSDYKRGGITFGEESLNIGQMAGILFISLTLFLLPSCLLRKWGRYVMSFAFIGISAQAFLTLNPVHIFIIGLAIFLIPLLYRNVKSQVYIEKLGELYALLIVSMLPISIIALYFILEVSSGIVSYVILTVMLIFLMIFFRELHFLVGSVLHRALNLIIYANMLVAICSIMLVVTAFEAYLQIAQYMNRPTLNKTVARNRYPLTIPKEWKSYPVNVEGASHATYWHGKLHVADENGMRRTTPFSPKREEYCRIMVVGDSITYGVGIDESDTYSRLIEVALSSEQYRVEILNLGIIGVQSQDILVISKLFTPKLQPDLILYGVCQNDFLNSGESERVHERRDVWAFPLPASFKMLMARQTLSGEFFEKSYDDLLMRFGIREDFFGNILANFQDYQTRFAQDVKAMNAFVLKNNHPPIIAMVLDQAPILNGRGHKVTRIAETLMQEAGMNVISTEDYYKKYDGRVMRVSPWEDHPNEEAHRIFAEYFVRALKQHPVLQQYKKE